MPKIKFRETSRKPISKKLIDNFRKIKNRKVIDISEYKKWENYAIDLDKKIMSQEDLNKYDPLHAAYIYGQNKVSVFVELLANLPYLTNLINAYVDAEKLYGPFEPPTSPITISYFTCWSFFDLCIEKETFGTIVIDIYEYSQDDPKLLKILKCMQNSRMGFYVHKGTSGQFVFFEELITKKQIQAIVPTGYLGNTGEIWFVRIMPEPIPSLNYGYSLVFTTPYIMTEIKGNSIIKSTEEKWLLFFENILKENSLEDKISSYEILMKYGLNKYYWNEFIVENYVSYYSNEFIVLSGFPDIG